MFRRAFTPFQRKFATQVQAAAAETAATTGATTEASLAGKVAAAGEEPSFVWKTTANFVSLALGLGGGYAYANLPPHHVNWKAVKADIEDSLDSEDYDDGSYGPVLVRLAWHASGTYDKKNHSGGSYTGATMRFLPESEDPANAGLEFARKHLEPLKLKYPQVSNADLWALAGCVAIEAMGGPTIPFRPGRKDAYLPESEFREGRLPDAEQGVQHLRDIFYRMGFNDREIVALAGAHALGRCHKDRSGYEGPWTNAPTTFSNEYYRLLLEEKWTPKKWDGKKQFEDSTGTLMMLPADMALLEPEFKKFVEMYRDDEELFFSDFAMAFAKLLHNK